MTRHLFIKDVRHTRILLLVWLLLIALQCVLMGSSVHPGDQVLQAIYYTISIIVPLFQSLVLVVLIPILVQEEPLVGTTAFWFTRPISRSTLLGAKTLYAAMLIALALLAEIGVLAANGVIPHDIGLAVPEIILTRLSSIAVIMIVATLTANFGRFAIAGAVVCVGWLLSNWVLLWLRMLHSPEAFAGGPEFISLSKSRGVVVGLLFIVGGGAVVIHQYLTRKTGRSIAGAVIVGIGAIAIMGFWPWNFLAAPLLRDSGVKIDSAAVTLSLGRSMISDIPTIRAVGSPEKSFVANIAVAGLPPGYVATATHVRPRLALPDGQPITVKDPTPFPSIQPPAEALETALGGTPIINRDPPEHMTNLLRMTTEAYNQYADQPLSLSADIDFVVAKYVVVAEMPLVGGSRYDHGSEHSIITDVLRQGDSVEVLMQLRTVQLLFNPAGNGYYGANALSIFNSGKSIYLLRNKKLNEALLEKQNFGVDFGSFISSVGKRLVHRSLDFSFGPDRTHLVPDLTAAWLADAELVRLDLVPVAEFSKQLTVEKLRLNRQDNFGARRPSPDEANLPVFARLTLPANPSKAEAREYVDAILAASQGRVAYNRDDPQVGMLAKVGPANIDVLLAANAGNSPNLGRYISWAVEQLARPEDKQAILRALPEHLELITVVKKYGWTADARGTLMSVLEDEQRRILPVDWIQAVASFEDPSSYPALKAYLLRCFNKQQTFNAIRKLPGIDLAATVDACWQKAKYGQAAEMLTSCGMAAELGHLDAVEAAVNILKEDDGNDAQQRRAAGIIRRFTSASGDSDALVAWFDVNKDHLVFDAKKKKFLPQPAAQPN